MENHGEGGESEHNARARTHARTLAPTDRSEETGETRMGRKKSPGAVQDPEKPPKEPRGEPFKARLKKSHFQTYSENLASPRLKFLKRFHQVTFLGSSFQPLRAAASPLRCQRSRGRRRRLQIRRGPPR